MLLAEEVLRDSGAHVAVYPTTELEQAASRTYPDMIVLELDRRGLATVNVAGLVRRAMGQRSPAIVFISHDAQAQDHESASEYGPVIDAPIDPYAFVHLVRDLHRERLASLSGDPHPRLDLKPLYA